MDGDDLILENARLQAALDAARVENSIHVEANDRLVAMVNGLSRYLAAATQERDDALAGRRAAEALVSHAAAALLAD